MRRINEALFLTLLVLGSPLAYSQNQYSSCERADDGRPLCTDAATGKMAFVSEDAFKAYESSTSAEQRSAAPDSKPAPTSTQSENEAKANTLLALAAQLWYQQKLFKLRKNQYNFNVKYGAPPISSNHKKMIYTDIPNIIKALSNCSVEKANRPINEAIIEKYVMTSDEKTIVNLRKMDQLMESLGVDENSPAKVPLKKDLNEAPNTEMLLKAQLNAYERGLKYRTNRNWCAEAKW